MWVQPCTLPTTCKAIAVFNLAAAVLGVPCSHARALLTDPSCCSCAGIPDHPNKPAHLLPICAAGQCTGGLCAQPSELFNML